MPYISTPFKSMSKIRTIFNAVKTHTKSSQLGATVAKKSQNSYLPSERKKIFGYTDHIDINLHINNKTSMICFIIKDTGKLEKQNSTNTVYEC